MYKNILLKELKFKNTINISDDCKDLISKLLIKNPKNRMGAIADSLEVMNHPWFSDIDWGKLIEKKLQPVFRPFEQTKDWTQFFDPDFMKMKPTDSQCWVDPTFLNEFRQEFQVFNFDEGKLSGDEVTTVERTVRKKSRSFTTVQDKEESEVKKRMSQPKILLNHFV